MAQITYCVWTGNTGHSGNVMHSACRRGHGAAVKR